MAATPQLLILDDDKTLVGVLTRIAARFGWKVTAATNKKEFLRALKTEHYDVVLTDYRMPDMDGLDVVRHLRWHGFVRSIIVMSAYLPDSVISALKELRVQAILPKPFHWQNLNEELRKALEEHPAAA